MKKEQSPMAIQLFYSYCHKDGSYRESMETSLAALKRDGLLENWSDKQILPGQSISKKVRTKMKQADIFVFLFSPDFIASEECMKECEFAKTLATGDKQVIRIPIILRSCAWKDVLKDDDTMALPTDAKPVASFVNKDAAWLEVFEGIKTVVSDLRNTFTPKAEFLRKIDSTEFISQDHLKLQDLFVFLRLTSINLREVEQSEQHTILSNLDQLLSTKWSIVFGEEKTGKTALARFIYLSLIDMAKPALLLDLGTIASAPSEVMLSHAYQEQFHGDYSLWVKQHGKTLILDNFNTTRHSLNFIDFAKEKFDNIIVTVGSDTFYAYLIDESRLADFRQLKIEQLTRQQQEQLIRRRLTLSETIDARSDGLIDRAEDHVNSVIISDKIVPRFPFFVLSILQTYEAYMPSNMSVTSYGHCYYILIFSSLVRAGISRSDDAINACFNFAEHLAFDIYKHREGSDDKPYDFQAYVAKYRSRFIIKHSIINRLKHSVYGIISEDGMFRTDYMYYYFLGRFLAHNREVGQPIIRTMCEESHRKVNYLTLLFTIHHTTDNEIIDDILLQTMCSLDSVEPATLNPAETTRFSNILLAIPNDILSSKSVEEERAKERVAQDGVESVEDNVADDSTEDSPANAIYRILKNNKIMGQILRNKYGNLEREKIKETIEVVADSGLRLVNYFLMSQEEIADVVRFIKAQHPDWDTKRIKNALEYFSFLWTMVNIELVVHAINVPDIGEVVDDVVLKRASPAYQLIGYFTQLDNADELTETESNKLAGLIRQHDDDFIKRVLSIRTQYYMNTHRSKAMTEQAVCSLLGIQYRHRIAQSASTI